MTRLHFILLVIFTGFFNLYAQQYEFGIGAGGGNYIGDIGKEYYFMPNKAGGQIFFKRTVNPWFSTRLNVQYFDVFAGDFEAESLGRQKRAMFIDGGIMQFSAGIEYNFLPRNPYIPTPRGQRLTPYMFTGLGVSSYFGTLYKGDDAVVDYNGTTLQIPMVLGIKYKLSRHFLISIETSAHYYFSDNLDGTEFYYGDQRKNDKYMRTPSTNLNSNDWFTFTSFSLIYTFGDLQCYFNM